MPYGSFICAVPEQGAETVALLSDCKYGYRGADNTLYADLIRGSYDPDPYPEYGVHHMSLAVAACAGAAAGSSLNRACASATRFMRILHRRIRVLCRRSFIPSH